MRLAPYTGITGFTARHEVELALATFPPTHKRELMVGVLASRKTMAGEQTRYPVRYPRIEDIKDIFVGDPRALNLIHFATDAKELLQLHLAMLVDIVGPKLHGFQLNVFMPDPKVIEWLTDSGKTVVLQLGARMLDAIEKEGINVLDPYRSIAQHVLIDGSGGRGEPMDVERVRKFADQIEEEFPAFGIGIAGGLCAETVDIPLLRERPHLSIDAEGKLRDEDDNLLLDRMQTYLRATEYLFP